MPPVAPPSHPRHTGLLRLALILGGIATIIVAILLYTAGFFRSGTGVSHGSVTFVASSAAATFDITGGTATLGKSIDTLGPVTTADGTTLSATLAMGPAHTMPVSDGPPIAVAAPKNEWQLQSGSGTALGVGRPLGAMPDGTALVLTDKGLVAYVPGGRVVSVPGEGIDQVGALSADGTLVALRNPNTHGTDLYTIAPNSFKSTYLASIPGETTAIAFDADGTLFVLTDDTVATITKSDDASSTIPSDATVSTVSSYSVSADAAPVLMGTAILANPWP